MSYISQMPLMRTRAADDGIVVNEILKYYRVSLLRAQVRLDLDLDGQQYVAEHQTWASFWPGEPFPVVDPRIQTQAVTSAVTSPAPTPVAVVAQPETTSSTILKELSAKPNLSIALEKEPQLETAKRSRSSIDANSRHSQNDGVEEEERDRDRQNQESHQDRGRNRNPDEDGSTHISISPSATVHPPNRETIICGNCSAAGHSLADCTYNIDEFGYLNGCPRCNTLSHNYADCPSPKYSHDDYFYLITTRHGKPPLRCRWDFRLGYWKKFKDCVYEDDTTAMRPQTPAFAKERRDRGVVQAWDEIVLDPVWYGRTDWTTNVGKMVHPLDKERVRPYDRQVENLSGGDKGSANGGGGSRKRFVDGERGVDENGRLRRDGSSDVSIGDVSVQELQGGFDRNQGIQRRPLKLTAQSKSRKEWSQGFSHDGRSWKKRRLEDQRMEQQTHGNPFGQVDPGYSNDQGRRYDNSHSKHLGFQEPMRAGFNNGNIVLPSPTPRHHSGNGFGNSYIHQGSPQAEQQVPTPYHVNDNPFPPIGPVQPPHGLTRREFGKLKANEARAKLGPLPGWKPSNTKMRNNNDRRKSLQNDGTGGFQRQTPEQWQMSGRAQGHRQGQLENFDHGNGRSPTDSQNVSQRSFGFRAGPGVLPPTQPLNHAGVQVDGMRAQASQNSNGFGVQRGTAPSPPVNEGPISARIGDIIASRGQRNGGRNNGEQSGGSGTHQHLNFNIGPGPQQGQHPKYGYEIKGSAASQLPPTPTSDAGGYCVNCRSHGHVIEECEGNCGLCRAGGHKARDCRFFDLGRR